MAYKFTQKADQDLADIYEYSLLNFGLSVADKYLTDLMDTFDTLMRSPKIGLTTFQHFRRFPSREHLIFYQIDGNDIIIIRILHGRMRHTISHLLTE